MAINWSKGVLKIEAITNVGHSFYDDYVEYTVANRNKMGVKEQIIRRQVARCCKWCTSLVGVYNYGEEPRDVYRRHDNCKCLVTHKSAKGYTDVHSKKVFATQRDARIKDINGLIKNTLGEHVTELYRIEQNINKYKKPFEMYSRKWFNALTKEEQHAIKKYTGNGPEKVKFYYILNTLLRDHLIDAPENSLYKKYSETISSALLKCSMPYDTIVYRSMSMEEFLSYPQNGMFQIEQFLSTSIIEERTLKNNPYKMTLHIHKGTAGCAYIGRYSRFPSQLELLIDKDNMYNVIRKTETEIEIELMR